VRPNNARRSSANSRASRRRPRASNRHGARPNCAKPSARAAQLAAAQLEGERQAAARRAASGPEATGPGAGDEEAKRMERLRAIGRQLDAEAAQREQAAAAPRSMLPLSIGSGRRVRLYGRTHQNPELVRYAESWAQKILLNTPVDTVRDLGARLRGNPVLIVAIRSDGSVESVKFELSSGVPGVDDEIRRIVHSHEHYAAFPPELARDYDVVEIRRTWHIDSAIRLY
jgi:hypothetical protein